MQIHLGKHKGREVEDLSETELEEMREGMRLYYERKNGDLSPYEEELMGHVDSHLKKLRGQRRHRRVSDCFFQLELD